MKPFTLPRARVQEKKLETLWKHTRKSLSTTQNMSLCDVISFAEIVQGHDASVRVTDDGLLYAVDLAMVATGNSRDYAGQVCPVVHEWDRHNARVGQT